MGRYTDLHRRRSPKQTPFGKSKRTPETTRTGKSGANRKKKCPHKFKLQLHRDKMYRNHRYYCDICTKTIPGEVMYGCNECKYDVCNDCFEFDPRKAEEGHTCKAAREELVRDVREQLRQQEVRAREAQNRKRPEMWR